ncbi:ATP-binding protein [Streptomyces parvulus]|uniref:ATP-binding protein n=1 Tax=Streptomyces parvulus TaxID=146923 RepID=A0A369UWH9_9ACTN|nr:ATP-binding protein [Streptomyces parvulus]RDD84633.1 ATP-binding protein [Streptomyces parvulus]
MSADSRRNVLAAQRSEVFTGRAAELSILRDFMHHKLPGCFVVWLHGMGGVGKSTLLHRFADEVRALGTTVRTVDMRRTEATPEAFAATLAAQGSLEDARLLLIDSGEALGPLEGWLRDEFLPGVPTHLLVLVGSRRPPAAEWRTDPQWWHALRSVRLSGMDEAEALQLLRNRQVPERSAAAIVRASHGLPLALSLFADARESHDGMVEPRDERVLNGAPGLARELVELLLREDPSPARSEALQVLALARVTTEELVRHALDVPVAEAEELFAWLRGLSFVESTAAGLVPHGLMREALLVDVRWRDPEKHERLFLRLHAHLARRLSQRTGGRWAFGAGLAYLARASAVVRETVDWTGADRMELRGARPEDLGAVLTAIEREHGDVAAGLAKEWWDLQPSAFTVARNDRGDLVGTVVAPCLEPGAFPVSHDPVAQAALSHIMDRSSPLRRAERLLLTRWSTGSAVVACFALTTLWATTPGLAVSWTCAAPHQVELSRLLDLHDQRSGQGFTYARGATTASFLRDWRSVPFIPWAERQRARWLADEHPAFPSPPAEPVLSAMPWSEFVDAVKDAYRNVTAPEKLAHSALLRTQLVPSDAGPAALRRVLTETVGQLRAQPGRRQLAEILEITYLNGPRSQQAAARRAALSFSTYRRRLSASLETAAELLRERELYGPELP